MRSLLNSLQVNLLLMATLTLGATVETARIPELVAATDPLTLNDEIAIWIQALDKTRNCTLGALKTAIDSGGGGTSVPPVNAGGKYLYIVPDDVGSGITTVALSQFAGMTFTMTRGGFPLIPQEDPTRADAEFEILDTGGFRLLQSGDMLRPGERYELTLFELIGGGGSGGGDTPGAVPATLFTGVFPITTNLTLNSGHFGKLLQIRNQGAGAITVTLPSVADAPANTIIVLETDINNDWENAITTSGGQSIYMQDQSRGTMYMRFGEVLWLYRGEDGWYVINNFGKIYECLGEPKGSYKVGVNQILCKGQLLLRSDYPRLWEWIQTLGSSVVSDGSWTTTNRGCFSTGDGSTTFRMPDLMNMFLRGIKSDTGSDTERSLNKPGGYQSDMVGPHTHSVEVGGSNSPDPVAALRKSNLTDGFVSSPQMIGTSAGTETRGQNVGVWWVINC
jgi:hypothetical protein